MRRSAYAAPKHVVFVSLSESCNIDTAARVVIAASVGQEAAATAEWPAVFADTSFKARLSLQVSARNVDAVLEHTRVADMIVFCVPAGE